MGKQTESCSPGQAKLKRDAACRSGKTASAISAVSAQGLLRFKVEDQPLNQRLSVELPDAHDQGRGKSIFPAADNLRVHEGRPAAAWAQARGERIEFFFLPPCSPEINPDEYADRALEAGIRSRTPAMIGDHKKRAQNSQNP